MTTEATERFRILNEFIGCGTLHAPIWFIGLEEAGEWKEDPEKDREQYDKYARRSLPVENGEIEKQVRQAREERRGYTKIYDIMSKLVVAITIPDQPNFLEWKEYRNKKLLQANGITFQANLFPLGKNSVGEWPDHYKNLFGFGKEDRSEYERMVISDRFPGRFHLLRSQWKDAAPIITVCFGFSRWRDFENLLKPAEPPEEFDNCKLYKKSGVILTPFFKYPFMPHTRIQGLAEKLRPLWEKRDRGIGPWTGK